MFTAFRRFVRNTYPFFFSFVLLLLSSLEKGRFAKILLVTLFSFGKNPSNVRILCFEFQNGREAQPLRMVFLNQLTTTAQQERICFGLNVQTLFGCFHKYLSPNHFHKINNNNNTGREGCEM